ncbi:putative nuclease YhcG [subsurface metagenome]
MGSELTRYSGLLTDIKTRIRQAQTRAVMSASAEMIMMYWDIGRMVEERQHLEGWGVAVIPRLSRDIRNDLPEIKGFSERNLKRMIRFYREYPGLVEKVPQAVAQLPEQEANEKGPHVVTLLTDLSVLEKLQQLVAKIPWGQNFLLIEKVKDLSTRLWYMQRTIENGWSRDVLQTMIKTKAHERQGKAVTNFEAHLPAFQSDLTQQALKDPYIFDFLTLDEPLRERELETGLVRHLEKFLLELGTGFSFVGRQYHLDVGDDDFYIDLLFYHLKLRCFVVIDLKVGPFKPGYAGKMNFYLNVVDDKLKHKTDNPSIGLILCQDEKKILAEYALRGMQKPIGISEYELTRALPDSLKSALPTIEEIEAELEGKEADDGE